VPENEPLPPMPSLELLLDQVASERASLTGHVESLDVKAGVVLGFSGVLVGLGATATSAVSNTVVFQIGLAFAVCRRRNGSVVVLPPRFSNLADRPDEGEPDSPGG
jgi:hypothetical protein